jgi:hypothetical protein
MSTLLPFFQKRTCASYLRSAKELATTDHQLIPIFQNRKTREKVKQSPQNPGFSLNRLQDTVGCNNAVFETPPKVRSNRLPVLK